MYSAHHWVQSPPGAVLTVCANIKQWPRFSVRSYRHCASRYSKTTNSLTQTTAGAGSHPAALLLSLPPEQLAGRQINRQSTPVVDLNPPRSSSTRFVGYFLLCCATVKRINFSFSSSCTQPNTRACSLFGSHRSLLTKKNKTK